MEFDCKGAGLNKLLQFRAITGTIGIGLTYYSLSILPLSDATVLSQVYPVMTEILAVFILHEKHKSRQLVLALVCIVGYFLSHSQISFLDMRKIKRMLTVI